MVRFSIIVPMYNVDKFLEECLTSVLEQSFDDFELILIDDGSTDQTVNTAQKFARTDKRISLYFQNHLNQASARNLGIQQAKGEYILFLDADDFWERDHLKKLHNTLSKDYDMCTANNHYNTGQGGETQIQLFQVDEDIKRYTADQIKQYFFTSEVKLPGATWLNMYNRRFLLQNKISFHSQYLCSEDLDFFLSAICKARSIALYDYQFYHYRIDNTASTINTMNSKKIYHRLSVYIKWYNYFKVNADKYIFADNVIQWIRQDYNNIVRDFYKRNFGGDDAKKVNQLIRRNRYIAQYKMADLLVLRFEAYFADVLRKIKGWVKRRFKRFFC